MFASHTLGTVELDGLERDYLVKRELGQGGMGVVYLARHRASRHEVAIKVIEPRLVADSESLQRIEREASLSARVQHPNIVRHYETRRLKNGGVALVRQYVPGETLASLLRRMPRLSFDAVSGVLADVLSGLEAVHEIGVVHRDVKPGNIFLEAKTGRALLSDFGIARALQGAVDLTQTGATIGTPMYMAPEQLERGDVDARADVYSVGLLAWEMLSGRRPWDGESLFVMLQSKRQGDLPPVTVLRTDTPHRFELALEGALATRPSHRWRSARDFREQLLSEQPTDRAIARREHVARSLQRAARRAKQSIPDGATIPLPRMAPEELAEAAAVAAAESLEDNGPTHAPAPDVTAPNARWRGVALVGTGAMVGGVLVALLFGGGSGPSVQPEPARAAVVAAQMPVVSAPVPVVSAPAPVVSAPAPVAEELRLYEPPAPRAMRFEPDTFRRRTHQDLARGDLRAAWGNAEVLARLGRPLEAAALMATIEVRSREPRLARERLKGWLQTRVPSARAFTAAEGAELARAWMALGDSAAALSALERIRPRDAALARALADPALAGIRHARRWQALRASADSAG